jgi:hypothetical protein
MTFHLKFISHLLRSLLAVDITCGRSTYDDDDDVGDTRDPSIMMKFHI